jgi:sugar/nucleoside kinase (ribokinase family)
VFTRVGDDRMGEYITRQLTAKFGVDTRYISTEAASIVRPKN